MKRADRLGWQADDILEFEEHLRDIFGRSIPRLLMEVLLEFAEARHLWWRSHEALGHGFRVYDPQQAAIAGQVFWKELYANPEKHKRWLASRKRYMAYRREASVELVQRQRAYLKKSRAKRMSDPAQREKERERDRERYWKKKLEAFSKGQKP